MIIKRQIELGRNQKTRDTRRIEQILSKKKGIQYVSISASGMMQLEWDDALTNESEIGESLKKLGLNTNFEKMHSHSDNHADNAPNGHAHAHVNIPFLGGNAELYFAIISGLFWLAGLIFSFTSVNEITPLTLLEVFSLSSVRLKI